MNTMFAQTIASRDLSSLVRWADDLPSVASDPRITVVCDLDAYTVGCCGNCWGRDETPAEWRIEYAVTEGGSVQHVDVCGSWCAQEKLTELLERAWYSQRVHNVTLRLPLEWAADEAAHLADVACEGQPGCTNPVSYTVTFSTRTHEARRECACAAHLSFLVDYAIKFGDNYTLPTVQAALSATTGERRAAA
jgi:hypothetical protein